MRQIYINARCLILKRIAGLGQGLQQVSDQYTLVHLQQELHKALYLKMRIEKRLKAGNNIIVVDFINKRKVA